MNPTGIAKEDLTVIKASFISGLNFNLTESSIASSKILFSNDFFSFSKISFFCSIENILELMSSILSR